MTMDRSEQIQADLDVEVAANRVHLMSVVHFATGAILITIATELLFAFAGAPAWAVYAIAFGGLALVAMGSLWISAAFTRGYTNVTEPAPIEFSSDYRMGPKDNLRYDKINFKQPHV